MGVDRGWGHASGEIDFHLTFDHEAAMSGGTKQHDPLFKITPEVLGRAGQGFRDFEKSMETVIIRHWRSYRPGWLARNGYLLMILGEDDLRTWFTRGAQKKRGKHRIVAGTLFDQDWMITKFREAVYDPRVLRHLDREALSDGAVRRLVGQITATRIHLGDRDHDMVLTPAYDLGGRYGWCGMPSRLSSQAFDRLFWQLMAWLASRVRPEQAAIFERIVVGMALNEVGHLDRFVESMRYFFRDPQGMLAARRASWPPR